MTLDNPRGSETLLPKYFWYAVTLFTCFLLPDLVAIFRDASSAPLSSALTWAIRLLVLPYLAAGIFAGICDHQAGRIHGGLGGFLRNALRYFPRFFCVNLLLLIVYFVIALGVLLAAGGPEETPEGPIQPFQLLLAPFLAFRLFWYAGIVVEHGKVGRSLMRGVWVLCSSPKPSRWASFGEASAWRMA